MRGNQGCLILDKKYQILIYAEDVNLLGEDIRTAKRNSEALLVTSKGISLEVKAEKTKYMFMSYEYNAVQNLKIKIVIHPLKGGTVQILGKNPNK